MEGNTPNIATVLNTAFTSIAGDVTTAMTTILPTALGVLGIGIVVMLGIKFFSRIVKKS